MTSNERIGHMPTPRRRIVAMSVTGIMLLGGCAAGSSPSPSAGSTDRPSATAAATDPAPTPTVVPTPTPVPTPEPITSTDATFSLLAADPPADYVPEISCDGDIGPSDPVAVVALKGGSEGQLSWVLRDYSDLANPRTVCTTGYAGLIDARHLLIQSGEYHAVVDVPEVTYHWFKLPTAEGEYSELMAIAPDLDAVVWARQTLEPMSRELVITDAAGTTVVAQLPAIEGGRCGSPLDSDRGDYQYGGGHYYVLDQIIQQVNALVVADGAKVKLQIAPPAGGWGEGGGMPLFAMWSPIDEVLYYRVGDDVMRWTPDGGAEVFLADTPWSHPSMTADGRYLAYEANSNLYLIDNEAGPAPALIRENIITPAFVNGSQLWYKHLGGNGCVIADDPDERIYDVRDGSDSPSVIEWVGSVWPQTSSNH